MSDLNLSGSEPQRIHVVHMARGADPDRPAERWLVYADYGWAETLVARCDYPHHVRAVTSALAIAYAVPVTGDVPAPAEPTVPVLRV